MKRRNALLAAGALVLLRPAGATPASMAAAIRTFTGSDTPPREGRVTLDIAPLVENGNTVPVTVRVASPMNEADHVAAVALFTERNPQPEVAVFTLGVRAGRAEVATRMRLATSQQVIAIAKMNDGGCWMQRIAVEVTLAACVE